MSTDRQRAIRTKAPQTEKQPAELPARWLPRFPNYDRARAVEEVTARISEAEFRERFVLRHLPCVIRGGAKHWPAVGKWNVETFRSAVAHVPVGENYGFRFEPMHLYSLDAIQEALAPLNADVTYADFIDEVVSNENPRVQLSSEPIGLLGALQADVADFDFFDLHKYPPRFYQDRLFLSRFGYTDWHAHTGDETLTVQVCAPKEFLLLPPDPATYSAMMVMTRRGVWRVPKVYWSKEFAALVPWRIRLEPGDVVYIPMHWWHAAESIDNELNISIARTFRTPLRWLAELRLPNARFSVLVNLVLMGVHSAAKREVAPIAQAMRLAALTLGAFPVALARNTTKLMWSNEADKH